MADLPDDLTATLTATLPKLGRVEQAAMNARLQWLSTARPEQIFDTGPAAPGVQLALAGRGWGKTRSACEAGWWMAYTLPKSRGGLVSPTGDDLRKVLYEGESGLQAVTPPEVLLHESWDRAFNSTMRTLHFKNGSMITGFTAEKPNRLRGPNLNWLVYDEMAAYERAQDLWDVSRFALRKGVNPISIITTTPKPIPLLFHLSKQPDVKIIKGSTYDNLDNLSPTFKEQVLSYEGTVFGRQEIHAELFLDTTGAIFDRTWLRILPRSAILDHTGRPLRTAQLQHVVLSLDSAFTEKTTGSDSAWIVFGVVYLESTQRYHAVVLDCGTANLKYPDLRRKVMSMYHEQAYMGRRIDTVLIEEKGSGIALLADMREDGIPVASYMPTVGKIHRAHVVSNLVSGGRMFFMEDEDTPRRVPSWARPLVTQILQFPAEGQKDDMVDAMTQGLLYLRNAGWLTMGSVPDPLSADAEKAYADEKRATREPVYG